MGTKVHCTFAVSDVRNPACVTNCTLGGGAAAVLMEGSLNGTALSRLRLRFYVVVGKVDGLMTCILCKGIISMAYLPMQLYRSCK